MWAKAAITQPLTDEAIGRCNQSQLSGLRYALYMGSNPDTAHRIADICVAHARTHTARPVYLGVRYLIIEILQAASQKQLKHRDSVKKWTNKGISIQHLHN